VILNSALGVPPVAEDASVLPRTAPPSDCCVNVLTQWRRQLWGTGARPTRLRTVTVLF